MHDGSGPAPVPSQRMRGWWSLRSRAKIWDVPAAPAAVTEPDAITEPDTITEPQPARIAVPPSYPAEGPPLSALFDPRPDDHLSRQQLAAERPATPVEGTIAESAYYERTSPAPRDPALADSGLAPANEATANDAAPDVAVPHLDSQGEFLRLLEVVTSMCDHVIEYIEADRAERRQMMEMLSQLGRVITEGSAAAVAAFSALSNAHANAAPPLVAPANEPLLHTPVPTDTEARERVIGGSMPAGPEPHIDLVAAESATHDPALATLASAKIHIAVEVRGQFGDRWVDGFEICEVMATPSGPRYRLRRQRDGVVLPELFDATNIRHVEPVEPVEPEAPVESVTTDPQTSRERSMGSHPSGSNGDSAPVNGSGYWSRS